MTKRISLVPPFEDGEAAVFLGMGRIPVGGGLTKFVFPQKLDRDVTERLGEKISEDVGEGSGDEAAICVGQCESGGIFALDRVDNLGGAEHDLDIVMTVPVHQSLGMWGNLD